MIINMITKNTGKTPKDVTTKSIFPIRLISDTIYTIYICFTLRTRIPMLAVVSGGLKPYVSG
jgi:hypothetical protein